MILWLVLTASMTGLLWLTYGAERVLRIGIPSALGYSTRTGVAGFPPADPEAPPWARRAHAAHLNAVENLPVFVALVVGAHLAGATGPAATLAAAVYFVARLAHFVVYSMGLPVLRTVAYTAAFAAEVVLAVLAVGALLG
ncbi:MAG: MAPEG family protein [Sandaracinaceae bacterium]